MTIYTPPDYTVPKNGEDKKQPEAVGEKPREIVFVIPGKDAPGFARRTRRALELRNVMIDSPTPENMDQLVEFIADYIKAPTRAEALELGWDASENQWFEMLDALGGASVQIPPPNSETSASP